MQRTTIRRAAQLLTLACGTTLGNNIQVGNPTLVNQDSETQTVEIQFDVSWENSWRLTEAPANWDAAWVFVKFHDGDGNWRHANLSTNDADHAAPAGTTVRVGVTDGNGTGVFVYRGAPGSGLLDLQGLRLLWPYGQSGVANSALVSIDVTAIEMVYVPEGSFYLGDGTPGGNNFSDGGDLDTDRPFLVAGEDEIAVDDIPGGLWEGSLPAGDAFQSVPAAFPKGYRGFYCMKYPVSQGQYIAFHNKGLSPYSMWFMNEATDPYNYSLMADRQSSSGTAPNCEALSPDRALCLLGTYGLDTVFEEVDRYLDWVGLRPMSEMEYEKACRGPLPPVKGELAWGTAVVATLPYVLADDGTPSERVATNYDVNAGNAWYIGTCGTNTGPCRVGMFAKDGYDGTTSGRIQSGATYYGIMNMSDNVHEMAVRFVFAVDGNSFDGVHGDGDVAASPASWGGPASRNVKGVAFLPNSSEWYGPNPWFDPRLARVSSRGDSGLVRSGIRGVRTEP